MTPLALFNERGRLAHCHGPLALLFFLLYTAPLPGGPPAPHPAPQHGGNKPQATHRPNQAAHPPASPQHHEIRPYGVGALGALDQAGRQRVLSQLPPDQRKAAEAQLREFDRMPPQERDRITRQYQAFQRLPPAKQTQIRSAFQTFQHSPPDRQSAMRNELHTLSALSPAEQSERLNAPEVRARFSNDERNILRGLLQAPEHE